MLWIKTDWKKAEGQNAVSEETLFWPYIFRHTLIPLPDM